MSKMRVLAGVSGVALAASLAAGSAKADNLIVDLSAAPPTLTIAAPSSAVALPSAQIVLGGGDAASTTNTAIGFPGSDPTAYHDLAGGTDTIIVDGLNSIYASAGSSDVVNQIDFYTATGSGTSSAATLGSLQSSASAAVTADVDNSNVLAQVIDLGAGSTVRVNDNSITADGTVNGASNLVYGNINNAESSAEIGQSSIDAAAGTVIAGATALAGNVQAVTGTADTHALVSDSRIGLLAQTSTEPNISGAPLDVIGNTISATFTGNGATTGVALTGDESITLDGTAGAVNAQLAQGGYTFSSEVRNVAIEAANTQDFGTDQFNADLSSSTLTLRDNTIMAGAMANDSTNSVALADNINLTGASSGRLNNFSAATDTANVKGDLFVANAQYTDVAVSGFVNDGEINMLTGDAAGSTVITDANLIGADVTGSNAVNTLKVGSTADFTGVVAINTVQYDEGSQSAKNDSLIDLDVGSTTGTAQSVTDSALSVDGNIVYGEAMGNSHSSTLDITGTTVTGGGVQVSNPILSTRTTTFGQASADFSLLNAQVLDGGTATADVNTWVNVDAGDLVFTTSSLSASDNYIYGLAIGNLATQTGIFLDATTLDGTVALASGQTVEDSTLLTSSIAPTSTAFIEVDVASGDVGPAAATVRDAAIAVDGNGFDSGIVGNLADVTSNFIVVHGVTVTGDSGVQQATASVSRLAPVTDTAVDHTIAMLNDQSVEDLNGAIATAFAGGDLINVTVGNANLATSVTDSTVTASGNSATTSAVLNSGSSGIFVGATSLDSASGLVNVQTVADQDGIDGSAAVKVDQNDLDIHIDVVAGDVAIENLTAQANGNSTLAAARLNRADNTVAVSSQTQTLSDTVDSSLPSGTLSALATGTGTYGHGESLLINDQSFAALGSDGVSVTVFDNEITVGIGLEGADLLNSVVETNGNLVSALSAGNDALNVLSVDVGSFDLSGADANGGGLAAETNGPIATLVSNQTGTDTAASGGFSTTVTSTSIHVEADNSKTNTIDGSNLSADLNTVRAFSRSNNVSNTLTATGTTVTNNADGDPAAILSGVGDISLDQDTFAIASRQVSQVDITSAVADTSIGVDAGLLTGDPLTGSITGTSISANGNLIAAEAHGNDAGNLAITSFVDNAGQATVANTQVAGDDNEFQGGQPLTYSATVSNAIIGVATDVKGSVQDSAFSASFNSVAALSSANRGTSELDAIGTNVTMRNGDNVTSTDPSAGDLTSDASLAVLNMQGVADTVGPPVAVDASVFGAGIGVASNGLFDSGSVAADANQILARAVEHEAHNTLVISASANIDSVGVGDDAPGASLASFQTVTGDSTVNAIVDTAGIAAIVDDPRSDLSFAASASGNDVTARAIGGTATNWLQASAGAEINTSQDSSPLAGNNLTASTLNAGFNVLNAQQANRAEIQANVGLVGIAAGGAEDYLNDSVNVNANLVIASSEAFDATNLLVLDAGSSSVASGAVLNTQSLDETLVGAGVDSVVIVTGNLGEGAEFSSLTVDGNAVEALSSGNSAVNALRTSAAATLQESSGAGAVLDFSATNPIAVTGADYAVLNSQVNDTGDVTAAVSTVGIGIDGLEAPTGVNDSALNVDGNQVVASAASNSAVNSLALNTGTFQHPSAGIANLQVSEGVSVSGTVDGVGIGIGGVGTTLSSTSTNSSFTVRGNGIGASVIGNSGVNSLTSGN
ncbi:MAG: hypothetical protein GC201_13825 [Alphaproteobacteria bacterium]|nr:hypothetical protein [Alphaproteobacteria bacterium]